MPRCGVTRRVHFNAAHRLHNPRFSDQWNRETFGECNNPNYHGHNYELELTVEGEIDPDTGYVLDLNQLKELAQERLLRHLDHKNLNLDVPWFRDLIPTSENIALVCWRELRAALPEPADPAPAALGDAEELCRLSKAHEADAPRRRLAPSRSPTRCARSSPRWARIPDREGLVKTPERVEASLRLLTQGYRMSVEDVVGDAVFEETHQSMIMVRDIELYSLCEHHLLPFFGRAHVAYIPNGKILGLSKVARIVDVFARRLQVQERLTDQIADAIMDVLKPTGVAS